MSLSQRNDEPEWMDDPTVAPEDLAACLADLAVVNRLTFAYAPTLRFLARATRGWRPGRRLSVLDVASGQGDMLREIRRWARRRGFETHLVGIDLSPSSATAARAVTSQRMGITFETADVFDYRPATPPDFIISSLFTHHLPDAQVVRFLQWMEAQARRGWFVNDLHRHPVSYHGFGLLARLANWHRFVCHDGPVSIARSFRVQDWAALLQAAGLASESVQVRRRAPFRLCVSRTRQAPP